jgi:hypothetical protein
LPAVLPCGKGCKIQERQIVGVVVQLRRGWQIGCLLMKLRLFIHPVNETVNELAGENAMYYLFP